MLQPDVTISGKQEICIGEFSQLNAQIISDPTGVTYFWENSSSISCTNCLDPMVNPTDTTVYTFVAISADGCETRTDFQVDVRPLYAPNIDLTNDTILCADDLLQLYVFGGNDVFSYNWDPSQPGLSCYDNCLNPIATPSVSTTYTVTVTNNSGCSSIGSVFVEVVDQNQSFAGEDRTICIGDTAQLHLNIGTNPLWLVSNGLDCSNCADPIASPQETTDFVAQVTTVEGCDIIDTVRVNVLSDQNIYAGEDFTICRDETALLNGQFLYGDITLPHSYEWTPVISLDNPNIANPEVFPNESTTYTLSITSGDCILRDSVFVEVVDKTQVEAVDKYVCAGDTTQLEIIGNADQFEWIPAEGLSDPNIANPTLVPTQTITYTLVASLASCEPDTVEAIVQLNELPNVYFPPVINFFEGESVLLELENATSDYTYEWFPSDGLSCTDCPDPTANVTETTDYSVTITDLFTGCQKVINITVQQIDECMDELVAVPNAFTPNEDGENDFLEIKYSSAISIDQYKMQIFDRWGGLVYESVDINEQWDGNVNGKMAPTGVYVYFLEFPSEFDGSLVRKKGDITIYR